MEDKKKLYNTKLYEIQKKKDSIFVLDKQIDDLKNKYVSAQDEELQL